MLSSIKPTYWLYILILFAVAAGYGTLFRIARHLAFDNDYAPTPQTQTPQAL